MSNKPISVSCKSTLIEGVVSIGAIQADWAIKCMPSYDMLTLTGDESIV